ncbi:hypothetical protein MTO96_033946 [Rhipicephalus appendiculatus]
MEANAEKDAYIWKALSYPTEVPTPKCLARAVSDSIELRQRVPGIFTHFDPNDMTQIHCLLLGEPGTPYEGGLFHAAVKLPPLYPSVPPRMAFLTTDGGRLSFHPLFHTNGKIDLNLLGTGPGPSAWNPAQESVKSVLMTVKSLMTPTPTVKGGDEVAYHAWNGAAIRHETFRVAVCSVVEDIIHNRSPLPESLSRVARDRFLGSALWTAKVVRDNMQLDGSTMTTPLRADYTKFNYADIYARLRKIVEG